MQNGAERRLILGAVEEMKVKVSLEGCLEAHPGERVLGHPRKSSG